MSETKLVALSRQLGPLSARERSLRRRRLPVGPYKFICTASHINFCRFDETVSTVFFTKVVGVTLRETNENYGCEA